MEKPLVKHLQGAIEEKDTEIRRLCRVVENLKKQEVDLLAARESAESANLTTQIFLQNIAESLPQYVFWKDVHSAYLGCNKNYAELVGLNAPEEIVGKTDDDLNWQPMGETTETFQKGDQETMAGHPITNQEEVLAFSDGRSVVTLVSKLPIINNGKVLGIVGCFTDITEIKQREKDLIEARRQAEVANKAKSTFMMNISHDIRTPLAGMIGMAEILAEHLEKQEDKETVGHLIEAGSVLLGLHNDVIEMTKLDIVEQPHCQARFKLKALMHSLVALFTPAFDEKGIALLTQYDEKIPTYLLGDHKKIHRILLNLIGNALKFTEQGHVTLKVTLARQSDDDVLIKLVVEDTGIGIPKDRQETIFSRFTRLDPSYTGKHRGAGLGLSIVKQFISQLRGQVSVNSEEGKGAVFTCLLPLKIAPFNKSEDEIEGDSFSELETALTPSAANFTRKSPRVASQGNDVRSGKKLEQKVLAKILIVEDNKIAQLGVKHQMEKLKCEVDTADTGKEGVHLLKKNAYDFVLMDIGLPDISGCEVTKQIRMWEKKQGRHTPIIALTAHIDEANKKACLAAGMEAVLIKPVTNEEAEKLLKFFLVDNG